MIKTIKNISLTAITIFCLMLGLQGVNADELQDERQRVYLQRHVEKVEIDNPQEYQRMLDEAGGVIMNCLSCHADEFESNENSSGDSLY